MLLVFGCFSSFFWSSGAGDSAWLGWKALVEAIIPSRISANCSLVTRGSRFFCLGSGFLARPKCNIIPYPCCWWFRNPAETHQLRLVVELPLFTTAFSTIPGGDLIFTLTFTLHINGGEEHATRNQPQANPKMNRTTQVLQLPSSRLALWLRALQSWWISWVVLWLICWRSGLVALVWFGLVWFVCCRCCCCCCCGDYWNWRNKVGFCVGHRLHWHWNGWAPRLICV